MELWRELLISGLQNESCKIDYINDDIIKDIIKSNSYKVLLEIKNILDDVKLTDRECFIIIEQIICVLERNNIFCDRHDF